MIINIFGCFIDWLLTRTWSRVLLLFALPLILILGVGGLTVLGSLVDRNALAGEYLRQGEQELSAVSEDWAFEEGSTEENEFQIPRFTEALFRRARELQSDDKRTIFVIAAMMGQRGSMAEAIKLMSQVSPDDRAGFVPGHAWLANTLMQQKGMTAEQQETLKHHLKLGAQWERAPTSIMLAAARLAIEENDQRQALELLIQSAEADADLEAEVFRLAIAQDNIRVAEQTAEKSLPRLLQAIEDGKATGVDRVALANILSYRKEYPAAEKVLVEGLAGKPPESDRILMARALSELYRFLFSQTNKLVDGQWSADLRILDRAMRADPSNPMIAEEIAKLARINGENPPKAFLEQLNQFLATGQATPITHAWLAEAYILRQEFDDAIMHLTNVVTREPEAADFQNNLAFALALHSPDRLPEALEHAQQAVKTSPRTPEFHDTLGYVLLKLKRLPEAVAELEIAIELAPKRIDFRQNLVEAYRAQGNEAMVAVHERFIEQLRAQQTETAPPAQP